MVLLMNGFVSLYDSKTQESGKRSDYSINKETVPQASSTNGVTLNRLYRIDCRKYKAYAGSCKARAMFDKHRS